MWAFLQTPACGSMEGKRPPLLVSKSIFFKRAAEDSKWRWALHPEDEHERKIFPSGSLSAFLCHPGRNTFVQADGWKIL